jgi:hypothetical protein
VHPNIMGLGSAETQTFWEIQILLQQLNVPCRREECKHPSRLFQFHGGQGVLRITPCSQLEPIHPLIMMDHSNKSGPAAHRCGCSIALCFFHDMQDYKALLLEADHPRLRLFCRPLVTIYKVFLRGPTSALRSICAKLYVDFVSSLQGTILATGDAEWLEGRMKDSRFESDEWKESIGLAHRLRLPAALRDNTLAHVGNGYERNFRTTQRIQGKDKIQKNTAAFALSVVSEVLPYHDKVVNDREQRLTKPKSPYNKIRMAKATRALQMSQMKTFSNQNICTSTTNNGNEPYRGLEHDVVLIARRQCHDSASIPVRGTEVDTDPESEEESANSWANGESDQDSDFEQDLADFDEDDKEEILLTNIKLAHDKGEAVDIKTLKKYITKLDERAVRQFAVALKHRLKIDFDHDLWCAYDRVHKTGTCRYFVITGLDCVHGYADVAARNNLKPGQEKLLIDKMLKLPRGDANVANDRTVSTDVGDPKERLLELLGKSAATSAENFLSETTGPLLNPPLPLPSGLCSSTSTGVAAGAVGRPATVLAHKGGYRSKRKDNTNRSATVTLPKVDTSDPYAPRVVFPFNARLGRMGGRAVKGAKPRHAPLGSVYRSCLNGSVGLLKKHADSRVKDLKKRLQKPAKVQKEAKVKFILPKKNLAYVCGTCLDNGTTTRFNSNAEFMAHQEKSHACSNAERSARALKRSQIALNAQAVKRQKKLTKPPPPDYPPAQRPRRGGQRGQEELRGGSES